MTNRGVTFLELILVIAVLLVIFVSILGNFQAFQRRTTLRSSAEQAQSYLRGAQNRAVTRQDDKDWGVRVNSNSFEMFDGSTYAAATNIQTLDLDDSITVTENFVGTDIVFTRLTGASTPAGDKIITFTQGGDTVTITVSTSGNIVLS